MVNSFEERHFPLVIKRQLKYDKPYQEVSFPVPWGNISGKWWGSTKNKPILSLHGFEDNCGSFDRLIPVLQQGKDLSFLAIDLPGHGYSSPFPAGMLYSFLSCLLVIERVYAQFKWTTLPLMGHSYGAIILLCYTVLYPERVPYIICIDALPPLVTNVSAQRIRKNIDKYMLFESKEPLKEPRLYTLEEIMQKASVGYKDIIKPEHVPVLMKRNIARSKQYPEKYFFSRDVRMKVESMLNWPLEQFLKDIKCLTQPIFVCESKNNPFHNASKKKMFHEVLDELKKISIDLDYHYLDGTHHLHLNDPENVGSYIKLFLDKHHINEPSNLKKEFCIFS